VKFEKQDLESEFSFFSRIGDHLEEAIPNIDTVIMTNNSIQELADIEKLSSLQVVFWPLRFQ
jgi:hypothetical protein